MNILKLLGFDLELHSLNKTKSKKICVHYNEKKSVCLK